MDDTRPVESRITTDLLPSGERLAPVIERIYNCVHTRSTTSIGGVLSNPIDVQTMSCDQIAVALDEVGIAAGWILGDAVRASAGQPFNSVATERSKGPKSAFQNLVVGTMSEHVFRDRYLSDLASSGRFKVVDYHEKGENRDFAVEDGTDELPINVKVASTLFRKAWETVRLKPEDCIPISAYKAIGASERVADLVYVVLVDFQLREKVDEYMDRLTGSLGILWDLLSWYGGKGATKAQDAYVSSLFATSHGRELMKLVPDATHFRVVSAQRVLAVMRTLPRRCPGLGVKAAGTGTFNAEVNIHISVSDETVAWEDVSASIKKDGVRPILEKIRRVESASVRAPLI